MARARRKTTTAAKPRGRSEGTGEFTCPECGRTFTRAAALGAHRRRAHGVVGATAKTRNRSRSGSIRTASQARTSVATRGRRSRTSAPNRQQVNRDALLQALFPNGVPAREAVIRAANDWLDQAEQLAKMR
jgi:predicted RNA-binding Zn-ribbon protein involved in translation (DUF1610 family)